MSKYQSIRDWGRLMKSFKYYIDYEVARAEADGAPQDAIYQKEDGTWATVADIKSRYTRAQMGLPQLTD